MTFLLHPGVEVTIGRIKADVSIGDDPSVSRNHAKLKVEEASSSQQSQGHGQGRLLRPKVILEDLGSSFGTYVGEEAIALSGNVSESQERRQVGRLKGQRVISNDTRIRFGLHSTLFK